MARFANKTPEQQALSVIKIMQKSIASVSTLGNYKARLERVASKLQTYNKGDLRNLTPQVAREYLEIRGQEIGQKTLDMERQSIQSMMRNVTNQLSEKETLTVVKSEHAQVLKSRSYTKEQVPYVAKSQGDRNHFSTKLAHACGLRAHELLTIARTAEQLMSDRPALAAKFSGREGIIYTVNGKGGLVREVLVPNELATKLESTRLDAPKIITDRGVNYTQQYDISGGQRWSNSFSAASNRALGWSGGAHGLRHSYAQERMGELHHQGNTYAKSLEIVSQEMGHFRPDITEVYLR